MIGVIDVEIQAANPSMPLFPIRAFQGSPSSVRVRNVPKKIGKWNIEKVYASIAYPDNTTHTVECRLTGGIYVGTISGCGTIGKVENGYSIFADGTDENGAAVTNYCLGKGDVQILDASGIVEPLQNTKFVQILSSEPSTPNEGDMWQEDGVWYIWQDNSACKLGDILTSEQSDAIQSVINERETIVIYQDNTVSSLNIVGELSANSIPNIDYADTVKVGKAVTSIGNGAFYGTSLTSVTIPNSVTSIGNNAFQGSRLNTITIPGSVTSIGADAFRNCAQLTNVVIEEGVTSIGARAFRGSSVAKVTIPKSVTNIDEHAFEDCLFIESVTFVGRTISEVQNLSNFPWDVFFDRITTYNPASKEWVNSTKQDKLSDPQISAIDSVVDERQTVITFSDNTTSAFNWSGEITKETLKTAGIWSDVGPTWIKNPVSIIFGTTISSIGYATFQSCDTLTSVTMPDSITSIGSYGFHECRHLQKADLPSKIVSIGEGAFIGDWELASVHLPKTIQSIGDGAFQ